MSLRVDLCQAFTKLAELEAGEFTGKVRNLAPGDWTMTTPLTALGDVDPDDIDSVLVVDEDTVPATVKFAGIVRRPDGFEGGVIREVNPDGTVLTWQGIDLWGLLACRLVWPTPSTPPPWADSHDTRTGVASTVAAGLIGDHIGATAYADRSITDLTVIDPETGTSGTWSFRLVPLSEAVAQVCREAGIGCLAQMTSGNAIRFVMRSYNDVSASVVLSDQGDLESLTRVVVPASASWVVAAGSGELTARSFRTASSGATGLDRVESLYDISNVSDATALTRAAAEQLAAGSGDVVVDGKIAVGAAQSLVWGTDYELGDSLAVEIDSVRYTSQVESIEITITPDRETVQPMLGRAAKSTTQRIVREVSGLADRFNRNIA